MVHYLGSEINDMLRIIPSSLKVGMSNVSSDLRITDGGVLGMQGGQPCCSSW